MSAILAAVDGHERDRDTIGLASALGERLNAEVVLVHTYPFDPLGSSRVGGPEYDPMLREAEEVLRVAATWAPHDTRTIAIAGPTVASGLHDAATRESAAMLVIGSSRRGTIGRIFRGTHTERIVHQAPCAVAVAPAGFATDPRPLERLIVAYDGSPTARAALSLADRMAGAGQALHLVAVTDPAHRPMVRYGVIESWERFAGESMEHQRAELEAAARELSRPVEMELRAGSPARELCDEARPDDVLLVGGASHGTLGRLVLGTTGDAVIRHAACPVVIVPPAGEASAANRPDGVAERAQA